MLQAEKDELYPLLFEPVYKEVLWGGKKMAQLLGRPIPDDIGPIGEAWDIVDREGVESEVVNGRFAGTSIHEFVTRFGREFVGSAFSGGRFPVMVKILDAGKQLSLQVHPSEQACAAMKRGKPKVELWYIMDADKTSKLYAGLKGSATKRRFLDLIHSPDIEEQMQVFDSIPGDAYLITPGRVHSIGPGNLICEIQQNSDTTYRVNDWGRLDEHGKMRQLHIDEALVCIDFMDRAVPRISGASNFAPHNRKYPLVGDGQKFRCDDLKLIDDWRDDTESTRSFHILSAINSPVTVKTESGMETRVETGASTLIPACIGKYMVCVERGVTTTVLRTTL